MFKSFYCAAYAKQMNSCIRMITINDNVLDSKQHISGDSSYIHACGHHFNKFLRYD